MRDLYDAFVVLNSERSETVKEVLKELLPGKEKVFLERLEFLNRELKREGLSKLIERLQIPDKVAENLPEDFPSWVASEIGLTNSGSSPSL